MQGHSCEIVSRLNACDYFWPRAKGKIDGGRNQARVGLLIIHIDRGCIHKGIMGIW
jgi:hypothetical protein